jgi:hypothetical protein
MRKSGHAKLAAMLATVCAMSLGACARHDHYPSAHRYGSLKDDPLVTGSVAPRKAKAPRKRIVKAAAPRRFETAPPVRKVAAAPLIEKVERAPMAPAPETRRPSTPKAVVTKPATTPDTTASAAPTTPTTEPPLPPVDEPAAVAEMLKDGLALFEEGKVVQARRRFVAAMNGPVPEVLLALARSYDTYYLSRLPTSDAAPDMQRALVLYERALERGAAEAAPDLERTRGILKIPR